MIYAGKEFLAVSVIRSTLTHCTSLGDFMQDLTENVCCILNVLAVVYNSVTTHKTNTMNLNFYSTIQKGNSHISDLFKQ